MSEVIKLRDKSGIARHTGVDEHGNIWTEFEVDFFAEQSAGECSICGAELLHGWQCMDGGEEVCDVHIEFETEGN